MQDDASLIAVTEFGPVMQRCAAQRFHLEALGEWKAELEESRSRDFSNKVDTQHDSFIAKRKHLFADDTNFRGDGTDTQR